MKKALITGVRGQDGAYLSQLLLSKGYQVYGADAAGASPWRLAELGVQADVKELPLDLRDGAGLGAALQKVNPDEVYNFAANSFVPDSFDKPVETAEINGLGVARLLEALRKYAPAARFYQASTAELFGSTGAAPKAEGTGFHPKSPYAVAKLYAHWLTVNYREALGLHASCGLMFNHESPLRGEQFLTRKITTAVARIKKGLQEKVAVGNLDGRRDWGYAKEFVEGMWLMLQQPKAGDYVLATGQTHTVREFIGAAFAAAGLKLRWQGAGLLERGVDFSGKTLVEVSKEFYRPAEVETLLGDASKAALELGWKPKTGFAELAALMVEADLKRLEVK
ncbi:MAG: GDP-mannose 4,6-dehydratase [Elusimicrobia bacterium]|nr:GDP-mannose 4,6-dehydratase [Elusimicrobiota bacterium]